MTSPVIDEDIMVRALAPPDRTDIELTLQRLRTAALLLMVDGHDRNARGVGGEAAADAACCRQVGARVDDRDVRSLVLPVGVVIQGCSSNGLRQRLQRWQGRFEVVFVGDE